MKIAEAEQHSYLLGDGEYYGFDAYSFSTLKNIVPPSTPYHYWLNLKSKKPPTAAMLEGTITHTAVLEPDKFANDYVFFDHNFKSMATFKAKESLANFKAKHPKKEIIHDKKLWYSLLRRRKNAWANRKFRQYMTESSAVVEQGMTWMDPLTGARMKGKPDHFAETVTVDVKTMQSISTGKMAKDIAERLYFMQGAVYTDGIYEVTGRVIDEYYILAIEKSSDLVRLVEISQMDIEIGRKLYQQSIIKAEDCALTQNFHGYIEQLVPLELPGYIMDKYENLIF